MVKLKLFNNIYKDKKVLITGHTGFKGSWLTLWLILLGADVVGFSNKKKLHLVISSFELKKKLNHILATYQI